MFLFDNVNFRRVVAFSAAAGAFSAKVRWFLEL
jgi:hypothetical protein